MRSKIPTPKYPNTQTAKWCIFFFRILYTPFVQLRSYLMNKNCACDFVFGLDWVLSVLGCFLALVWVGEKKKKGQLFWKSQHTKKDQGPNKKLKMKTKRRRKKKEKKRSYPPCYGKKEKRKNEKNPFLFLIWQPVNPKPSQDHLLPISSSSISLRKTLTWKAVCTASRDGFCPIIPSSFFCLLISLSPSVSRLSSRSLVAGFSATLL